MSKNKIKWCLKQKKGVKMVELKPHLSEAYLKEADESLDICSKINGKWKLISGYYACYNAFYAILMKAGIKCEIHDCSIELMPFFGFNEKNKNFLSKLKDDRIRTQYYLKDVSLKSEKEVKDFVTKCKEILLELNSEKIEDIRREIESAK